MPRKELFEVTRSSKLGLLQILKSVVLKEKVVCGLLLSPAESAKQAINKPNFI